MVKHSQDMGVAVATRPGITLLVLCASACMAGLDVFIVNVAFDDIGRDFPGSSLGDLSWVLNAYAIVYAALLVPLGSLADRLGSKRMFLAGVAVFTVASAACAASPGLWHLVTFRALQAAGAAALTPASLGLLLAATPTSGRARAVRIWSASGALAAAGGPALGGLLVESSWQWVFLVNVPVGVLALAAGARYVPADSRGASGRALPDILGTAVLAVTVGVLSLTIVKGPDWGWASKETLLALAATVAGALVFASRVVRHPVPVIAPALLRVRTFAWSNAVGLLFSLAFGANLLASILWMQQTWGYSAVRTGLAVAPGPLMVPVFAAIGQRVAHRVSTGTIVAVGSALYASATALLALRTGTTPHYAAEMLPSSLLSGAGVGLAMPTILAAATTDLPADQGATGSAVVTMSRQIGTSLGVAALVAVLASASPTGDAHAAFARGWWIITGAALLSALAALGMTSRTSEDASVAAVVPTAPDVGVKDG
ncbi:MFS transporter [Streptomyces sp. NPDC005794]|uniref:MFS transporter n=1 Tax=Streptomyces sp. NPDC005794 TaxID=3364733 RepID=UPI00367D73BE